MAEPAFVPASAIAADATTAAIAANDPNTTVADRQSAIPDGNLVKTTIDTITQLMNDTHDVRENLVAGGIPFQTVNVLLDMTLHKRVEARDELVSSALAAAQEALGDSAVDRLRLVRDLDSLVEFEKDIAHARRVAREQGLNVAALNSLTQMIRHHPGDGGAQVIREFIAYAIACQLPIADAVERAESLTSRPVSVLPHIERKTPASGLGSWRTLAGELALGLAIGVMMLMLV